MRTDRTPIRLTRRGERVRDCLLVLMAAGAILLSAVVDEVPKSNPLFGISSEAEGESK